MARTQDNWSFGRPAEDKEDKCLFVINQILNSVSGSLQGLHWVERACQLTTAAQMSHDVLVLVARLLNAPLACFLEAGGVRLVVSSMRKHFPSKPYNVPSKLMILLELARKLVSANEETAAEFVKEGGHCLIARLATPGNLPVDGGGGGRGRYLGLLPEDVREIACACAATLRAIVEYGADESRAVDNAERVAAEEERQACEARRQEEQRRVEHEQRLRQQREERERQKLARQLGKRSFSQMGSSSSNVGHRQLGVSDPCVCTVCHTRLRTPSGMLQHRWAVHRVSKAHATDLL